MEKLQRVPKIKKVLRRELVLEYQRLKQDIALERQRLKEKLQLLQMDLDAVDSELRLLLIHGYLPRIGEPEVWIDGEGVIRIDG